MKLSKEKKRPKDKINTKQLVKEIKKIDESDTIIIVDEEGDVMYKEENTSNKGDYNEQKLNGTIVNNKNDTKITIEDINCDKRNENMEQRNNNKKFKKASNSKAYGRKFKIY